MGFFILFLAVFLWSLAFLYTTYRLESQESVLPSTGFSGKKGLLLAEKKHPVVFVSPGYKMGAALTACTLRFFLVPDYYGFLLLLFIASGVSFGWLYLFRRARAWAVPAPAAWERIYSLPEGYAVFLVALNKKEAEEDWIGATLSQLDLRKKNLLVLAILRSGRLIVFPKGQEVLSAGDRLLIFGRKNNNN